MASAGRWLTWHHAKIHVYVSTYAKYNITHMRNLTYRSEKLNICILNKTTSHSQRNHWSDALLVSLIGTSDFESSSNETDQIFIL